MLLQVEDAKPLRVEMLALEAAEQNQEEELATVCQAGVGAMVQTSSARQLAISTSPISMEDKSSMEKGAEAAQVPIHKAGTAKGRASSPN